MTGKRDWVAVAAHLKFDKNVSWTQMPQAVSEAVGYPVTFHQIRQTLRAHPRYGRQQKQESGGRLDILPALPRSLEGLSERFDRAPKTVLCEIERLQGEGYDIREIGGEYRLGTNPTEENRIVKADMGDHFKFGMISDTHLCSKYQQLTHLNAYYDICQEEGVKVVYHSGDIADGVNMYKGHLYEVFLAGADDQVDYITDNYPHRPSIKTEFITGNHDLSFYKREGYDIGRAIENRRSDLKYLGQFAAYVEFAPNILMYLLHPDSGPAYATSYKPQRIAAGFIGGEKPHIMGIGHYHQTEFLFERNIHILQTVCFQAQTPFLKRKGIMPKIGGWIVEVKIKDGGIARVKMEFIPFYVPIPNDY